MKDRPILFSGAMVRALLAGTKTQTRRVVKPHSRNGWNPTVAWQTGDGHSGPGWYAHDTDYPEEGALFYRCPYGKTGDRLWVRECHYLTDNGHEQYAVYAVDDDAVRKHLQSIDRLPTDFPADTKAIHRRLRPSIHMPRWASRITLEITSMRVERLQDISPNDCIAEGAWPIAHRELGRGHEAVAAYQALWESINGPGSWDANPWVWVVEFRRLP